MKAIIIGATSGIGRELAIILAQHGYTLGLTGRREPLLAELRQTLPTQVFTQPMNVADCRQAMDLLQQLITQLGGVDLVVISAGTGFMNPELSWLEEQTTIDVNVTGFAAMANVAFRHFVAAGCGHLVGISSIAALRGSRQAPAYSASKAFVSNYLEGLRCRAAKARLPITVTDIQPGFVDTRMAQGEGLFWVASPQEAARQIYQVILRRAPHAYITRRWRLVAWLLRLLPGFIFTKL